MPCATTQAKRLAGLAEEERVGGGAEDGGQPLLVSQPKEEGDRREGHRVERANRQLLELRLRDPPKEEGAPEDFLHERDHQHQAVEPDREEERAERGIGDGGEGIRGVGACRGTRSAA